ncbi:hypothetical protein [Streptomyces sp. NPDC001658]
MTDQPTNQQLDKIEACVTGPLGAATVFDQVTVALLVAEVRRLRATPPMVCINCETPVGWVDCPTGGWWAHETHPADDHDADPRPARQDEPTAEDTLPAWLARRFDPRGADWDGMSDDDRAYWAHQAAAVRRAVARGGFKTTTLAAVSAVETGR